MLLDFYALYNDPDKFLEDKKVFSYMFFLIVIFLLLRSADRFSTFF